MYFKAHTMHLFKNVFHALKLPQYLVNDCGFPSPADFANKVKSGLKEDILFQKRKVV